MLGLTGRDVMDIVLYPNAKSAYQNWDDMSSDRYDEAHNLCRMKEANTLQHGLEL